MKFKKVLLILALGAIGYTSCQTDYKCQTECVRAGYSWGFCKYQCSYCTEY